MPSRQNWSASAENSSCHSCRPFRSETVNDCAKLNYGHNLMKQIPGLKFRCDPGTIDDILKPINKMKLKKRKIKFAAIFGVCWFALLVLLVDGILKFQTLVDYFGSYALVEISLILLVVLPTLAVYIFTKE